MNANKDIKIAYLTHRDPLDKLSWSGVLYYMYNALNKNVGEVIPLGPYEPKYTLLILKVFKRFMYFLFRKNYNIPHSKILGRKAGRYFSTKVQAINPDVIVAVASTPYITYLKTQKPLIIVDDINFSLLLNYYPKYTNLFKFSIRESQDVTIRSYQKADAVVFSSEWAKQSTIKDDGIDKNKIHVIPFGCNLDEFPSREKAVNKDTTVPCKLLFLSVDWYRQGGEFAFNVLKGLNQKGLETTLTVVGCIPPEKFKYDKMHAIPFLNKNNPVDYQKLIKIYFETNFLIRPSSADCTPMAFNEVNAYGIPALANDVGGVSSVIESGVNGILHPLSENAENYINTILDLYSDPDRYKDLVRSSRDTFDNKLNWDSWSKSMEQLIKKVLRHVGTHQIQKKEKAHTQNLSLH